MNGMQETCQQKFKVLLQEIYSTGVEAEKIQTSELILEIKKRLSAILEKNEK